MKKIFRKQNTSFNASVNLYIFQIIKMQSPTGTFIL